MAAPYGLLRHLGNFRLLACQAGRTDILPTVSAFVCPKHPCIYTQTRHKMTQKQRVKEKKQDVEKEKRSLSKKELAKMKKEQEKTVVEKETFLADAPIDNVWLAKHYPPQKFSLEQILKFHKAYAQPEMLNNSTGIVYLNMKLDLTTKKKTKFMHTMRQTLNLPHEFPYGNPPKVLVLCKKEEDIQLAAKLGAKSYGTPKEISKLIDNFVISPKDFDHVLCTIDCGRDVLPLRSHFKEKFPQKGKGNLGENVQEMWDLHYSGYTYETTNVTDSVGAVQVPLGLVEQPTEDLIENFKTYIKDICNQRSLALGPFITSIKVVAPPSPEEFLLKVEDYVPGYNNEEYDSDEEEKAEALTSRL